MYPFICGVEIFEEDIEEKILQFLLSEVDQKEKYTTSLPFLKLILLKAKTFINTRRKPECTIIYENRMHFAVLPRAIFGAYLRIY